MNFTTKSEDKNELCKSTMLKPRTFAQMLMNDTDKGIDLEEHTPEETDAYALNQEIIYPTAPRVGGMQEKTQINMHLVNKFLNEQTDTSKTIETPPMLNKLLKKQLNT